VTWTRSDSDELTLDLVVQDGHWIRLRGPLLVEAVRRMKARGVSYSEMGLRLCCSEGTIFSALRKGREDDGR
jgi:hypothetical protein